jgi:hypothetical protein
VFAFSTAADQVCGDGFDGRIGQGQLVRSIVFAMSQVNFCFAKADIIQFEQRISHGRSPSMKAKWITATFLSSLVVG